MALIDKDQLKKFKEALADIIVSSQGLCTYDACKDVAEREATLLISMLLSEPNIQSSNIKETIRAEIERRKKEHLETAVSSPIYGAKFAEDCEILAFLDTLPEQPVEKKSNALFEECLANVDPAIRKEVSDNIDKMLGRKPVEGLEKYCPYKTTVESILKMFNSYSITTDKSDFINNIRVKCKDAVEYDKLFLKHLRETEQPVSEDLDVELKRMVYDAVYDLDGPAIIGTSKYLSVEDIANIARHFAEWGATHLKR